MKGLKEQFEETFNALWPQFNYKKRTISSTPEELEKECKQRGVPAAEVEAERPY